MLRSRRHGFRVIVAPRAPVSVSRGTGGGAGGRMDPSPPTSDRAGDGAVPAVSDRRRADDAAPGCAPLLAPPKREPTERNRPGSRATGHPRRGTGAKPCSARGEARRAGDTRLAPHTLRALGGAVSARSGDGACPYELALWSCGPPADGDAALRELAAVSRLSVAGGPTHYCAAGAARRPRRGGGDFLNEVRSRLPAVGRKDGRRRWRTRATSVALARGGLHGGECPAAKAAAAPPATPPRRPACRAPAPARREGRSDDAASSLGAASTRRRGVVPP